MSYIGRMYKPLKKSGSSRAKRRYEKKQERKKS